MAKTGRIKVRGGLCAGMVLVLTMTVTVYYVQAIELGGFDVDMGTGSFEGDASDWKQDAEEEMPAGDENYVSGDGSWSNSDSSWTTGETSEAGNDAQPETGGEDFFHQDSMKRRLPVRLIMRRLQKKTRFQTGRRKTVL